MWIYDVIDFIIMTELFCIVVQLNFLRVMPGRPFATQKLWVPVIILWYGPLFTVQVLERRGGHPFPSSSAVKPDADLTFDWLTVTKLSKGSLNRSREAKMGLWKPIWIFIINHFKFRALWILVGDVNSFLHPPNIVFESISLCVQIVNGRRVDWAS